MKKISFALSFALLLLTPLLLSAQTKAVSTDNEDANAPKWTDRLFFTGNMGLNIGANTFIQANPMIGYRLSDRVAVGLGPNYTYLGGNSRQLHIYGGSLFSRATIVEGIFAHAELEQLFFRDVRLGEDEPSSIHAPALLVGGGVRKPLGGRSALIATVLYDVLQDENSIYGTDLIIRGGVSLGF